MLRIVRIAEGNGLGNQLSDDKREIGNDYHSGDHGQITCIGFRSRYEGEERDQGRAAIATPP